MSEGAENRVSAEIRDSCLRLLAQRDHSRKELLNKCVLKGFPKEGCLAVIEELAEQGWQDDQRYAESCARFRIQKGYGPQRVIYELRQNGIESINLDVVLNELATTWLQLLEQVYRKKYKDDRVSDRAEWAKRSRFLLQRGFSGEMISELFDQLTINKH